MFEKFMDLLERGVLALEKIAAAYSPDMVEAMRDLAVHAAEAPAPTDEGLMVLDTPEEVEKNCPANTEQLTPEEEEAADASAPQFDFDFDPYTEPIHGPYRTADKQGAIDAALADLGIEPLKSWNYVRKHEEILKAMQERGQQPQQQEEHAEAAETPPLAMNWEDFVERIKPFIAALGKEEVRNRVEGVIGEFGEFNPANVPADQFINILEALDAPEEQEDAPEETGGDEDLLGGGGKTISSTASTANPSVAGVVKTMDDLIALCREKSQAGTSPKDIQAAIKHLAPGVTQVPADKINEAYKCLEVL